MLLQTDRLSSQFPLRPLSVLVFHLLLTHSCRGQSQLMGPPHPIVATLGHDVILPCHLEPEMDVTADTLEWTRSDLNPIFVNVLRAGQDLQNTRNPSYKGRTSLFRDQLKHGNISLKLSKVQLSDLGTYTCDIPLNFKHSFVKLVLASGPSSPPVISLSGLDGQRGGVVLQCESAGWYPEPEVLWLDAEGKLLSAGPPETVRGPDDLYTVSSRVTLEKGPSNSFTCRVQHHNTNRTTQTHFHFPDDFFIVPSSCSASVAVSGLFGFMLVIAAVLFVWKWRQTKTGEKKNRSETEEGGQLMEETLTDQKAADLRKIGKELKETQSHLEIQITENSREKTECNEKLLEEKNKREEELKDLQREMESKCNKKLLEEKNRGEQAEKEVKDCNKKLLEEKNRGEEAEKEVKELNEEPQTGRFGGSDNSGSVEPPRTPPSTQTSDSGFNIEFDQQREFIRLINTSTEEKQLEDWELHLQVNDNKPFTYKFDPSFYLRAGGCVNMWARGYGSNDSNTDLVWNDLKSLGSGDKLKFTLFNDTGKNMNTVWHNPK